MGQYMNDEQDKNMNVGLTPPKKRMPLTVEELVYLYDLYSEKMAADKENIRLLKEKVNRLEQKILQYKSKYNTKQDY